MPALTAPQLALLRRQPQTSEWFIHPVVPVTVFAARINDAAITVGARTITYDTVTIGAYTDVIAGMSLWVGTAPNTYNVARIRVRSATSAHLIVAENSDVAWADNYYLTVKREWLCWSIRPFINNSGTVFKDYDIAYSDQTTKWPPVAMMGDPVCKPWAGNPTAVYFDGSESYATSPGAAITSYAWNFGDGTTSTAATPGNHNYTSAGDRWVSLTVTDSNGKTCVTYRPVSLPDAATLYTAKFEEQSLDAAIDAGWTGQCSVFAPLATTAEFPERAPVFLIAVNSYGGTAGSVGYPRGRENVVLFGYIQDDSVEETPETSQIQFTMESVDKVAARAAAITTFVGDATTPANWDEGKSLNIFRSFVYLLAFQSTLFQIADVRLFNDTTLIKIARFPEDNLWNMFAQFARGARLMRVGVTRTGRVIVARDPNLLPIASRGVVTTVCQLQDGDWADTVTIPEHPYPATSFLCLSGISYDGNPANDPTPLFGMSPGHPPKEYGVSREIHDLALVSQLEAEILAGLSVGQDNNAFGEVNIPLWANWIGAFDPAYQEYVRAPAGGFVTNRGVLLDGDYLIVRKVSIGFDWEAGVMRSILSCEVYSYPDISMVGDCYTTDAPLPPPPNTPPVVPPPPPPVPGVYATISAIENACLSGDSVVGLTLSYSGGGLTHTFYIERSIHPTSGFVLIGTLLAASNPDGYTDTTVLPSRTYYYRVRAEDGGVFTVYSAVSSQAVAWCAVVLSISTPSCSDIQLDWTNVSGENGYQIWRLRQYIAGEVYTLVATVGVNVLTYTDVPSPAGRFTYKVRAFNAFGSSAYSNEEEACGGVGIATFPQHAIAITADGVFECTDLGKADLCQPTWVDITGPLPSGGVLQWDGASTLSIIAGNMVWTKPVSGGAWTAINPSNQDYALSHGFWQNIFDPSGAFPGHDPSEHYTPTTSIDFGLFIGQDYTISHGMGFISASRDSGMDQFTCAAIWNPCPVAGVYLNNGKTVLWTESNFFGVTSVASHISKHPNEPFRASLSVHSPGADYDIIDSTTENEEAAVVSGPPCVFSYAAIDEGNVVYHNTSALYYWHSDPNASAVLWLWTSGGALRKSTDAGSTYSDTAFNVIGGAAGIDWVWDSGGEAQIVRAPFSANFDTFGFSGYAGFYESRDAGATWTLIDGRLVCEPEDPGNFGMWNVGTYPDLLFMNGGPTVGFRAGHTMLNISEDGGLTWFNKAAPLPDGSGGTSKIIQVWIDPNS